MPNDTALLVIDVQVGMFDPQYPVYNGPELLEKIGGLINRARTAGTPIIYIQHAEQEGGPLIFGTDPWQIHPAIEPGEGDTIVHKRFPDSFQQTNLQETLAKHGIKKLVVCGIQTDFCVDTTCRRAFSLDYEVTLVRDAHSTWSDGSLEPAQIIEHHNTVLGSWFVKPRAAAEIEFEPAGAGSRV